MGQSPADMRAKEFIARACNDVAQAEELLKQHPRILRHRSSTGETPLHYLVVENRVEAVRMMLRQGAAVNTCNTASKGTPLHDAVELAYEEMVTLLLEHDAEVNAFDHLDETPLHKAINAKKPNASIVTQLLRAGAKPDKKKGGGESARELAVRRKREALLGSS